jgi:hydrogenase nickel incorporation protein HypB
MIGEIAMTTTIESPVRVTLNVGAAAFNRELFARHGVLAVSLFGGHSCGKTSLLEATLRHAGDQPRIGVIVGNILAEQDAEQLRKWSQRVFAIEAVDLTASLVHEALARIDLSELDVLLIERAGTVASPDHGCEDLGQTANVGIFSVAGGDDKVARYPQRVEHSDLLLLTKIDLLPHIPFDLKKFRQAIRRVNPAAPLIELSAITGRGLEQWLQWLRRQVPSRDDSRLNAIVAPEIFFG